jgi:hypothetical protein
VTPFALDGIQVDPDAGRGVLDASREEALDAAQKVPDEDLDVGLVLGEDLKRRGIDIFYSSKFNITKSLVSFKHILYIYNNLICFRSKIIELLE